jgi:hypothetical protein
MRPAFSIYDSSDSGIINSNLYSYLNFSHSSRSPSCSNVSHFFICKPAVWILLSPAVSVPKLPSFFGRIVRIVLRCSEEKMIWIYTARIVATMANKKPFGKSF